MGEPGPDVFLSYAGEDEARARELATALGQHGLSVFWDREIPPGETWHSHIGEALAQARCVVVAWSHDSIASQWVLEEASEGRDRKVLVPVLFEAVAPPFGFRAIQAANLVDWRSGRSSPAFDGLLRAVQRIVGGQARSGTEAEAEVAAPPQPAPSEPAPKTSTKPGAPPPTRREPRAATVRPPDGQATLWSRRTVAAMIGGLVALAGAGGIAWWLTQPGAIRVPPPAPSIAESKPSKPVVDVEIARPAAPERTSAASPRTGESPEGMRDCPECPEMVLVPAGEFTMGSPPDEPDRNPDEGLQRRVTIAAPLWVGRYEVTFAEWDACFGDYRVDQKCSNIAVGLWESDDQPVTVHWSDAKEYVRWLREKLGKPYRLLSEAEWEYVARAGTTTAFWWGKDVGKGNANCAGCGSEWDNRQTAPVGSFGANAFGLHDTAGNVWEWVEDCWHDSYNGAPTDGSAWVDGDCSTRVLRGGSWNDGPRYVRSANRDRNYPYNQNTNNGFRVARAPD